MKRMAGKPIIVQVLRVKKGANDATTSTLARILVPPAYHATLGMKMKMGEVAAVRDRSAAADKVQPGDVITAATVTAGAVKLGEIKQDDLDPVRLPFTLEELAAKAPAKAARSSRANSQALGGTRTEKHAVDPGLGRPLAFRSRNCRSVPHRQWPYRSWESPTASRVRW